MSTTHIVTDQSYAVLFKPWLEERLDYVFDENARYIGNVLLNEDRSVEILFVVAYAFWAEHSVSIFAASDGSKRQKMSALFWFTFYDFAYNHNNVNLVYSYVKKTNTKSIELHKIAGMRVCGELPGYYGPGEDAIVYGQTKQQWLDGKWSSPTGSKGD